MQDRATLKNCVPYVDDEFKDIVFMVPKYVSRQWRWSEFQTPDHVVLSVFMRRNKHDPLLLLDLPSDALLHLRRRASAADTDEIVTARVRCLQITDYHGRRADIEIVLI
jgi:hypothetical protein